MQSNELNCMEIVVAPEIVAKIEEALVYSKLLEAPVDHSLQCSGLPLNRCASAIPGNSGGTALERSHTCIGRTMN